MADKSVKQDIQQLLACCNEFFDKKDADKNSAVIASIINGLDKLSTIDLYALRAQLIKSLDAIQANQVKPEGKAVVSDYKLVNGNNGQFMVIEFTDQNKEGKVVFTTTDRKAAEELINQNSPDKTAVVSAGELDNQQQPQQPQNNPEQMQQDVDMPPMDEGEDNMPQQDNQQQQNGGMDTQQLQRIDNVIQQATNLADKIEKAAHEHTDLDAMKDLVVDVLAIRSAVDAIQNASTDDVNIDEMVTNLENQLPQFEEKATNIINKAAPDLADTDVPETENFDNADNIDMPQDNQPQQDNQQQDMTRPMSNQQGNQELTSAKKADSEDSDDDDEDVDIMAESEDSEDSPSADDIADTLDEDTDTNTDFDGVPADSDLYKTLSELSDLVSDEDSTKEDISDALDDILDEFDEQDSDEEDSDDEDDSDKDYDEEFDQEEDLEEDPDDFDIDEDLAALDDEEALASTNYYDDEEIEANRYFRNRNYDKPVESGSLLESEIWKNDPLTEKGVKVSDKPSLSERVNLKERVSDTPDDANTVDDTSALNKQGLKKVTDKIIPDDTEPLDGKNPVEANVLKWKEFDKKNVLVTKQKTFKTEKAKTVFANKLKDKDNFYSII